MHTVKYSQKSLKKLKNQHNLLQKISIVLKEISIDPYSKTHKFERLKHNHAGFCSKRIDKKNRIVYQIKNNECIVL